jgi:F-type H+-transporting ATPase subunit b
MRLKNYITVIATLFLVVAMALPVMASGDGGHADGGKQMTDFIWRMFNFAVTIGILVFFVRKPIKNGLAGRREGIAKALEEAEKAQVDAEAKFAEYDEKLNKAEAEIETIAADLKREGELERERIIAQAKESAEKIRKEAEKSAEFEIAKAKAELMAEATRLAVELAEDLLKKKFSAKDESRLLDEYMKKVGELH